MKAQDDYARDRLAKLPGRDAIAARLRELFYYDALGTPTQRNGRLFWTSSNKLAISGDSNGGLLVGAATVQAPELFKAVVCGVPVLDMVRYHKFGPAAAWISELGAAEDATQFQALHAYSPYHHVHAGASYPALLMLSSDHDDRVDPMHARKFTAALQAATTGPAPVWLRIEQNAGHGGADAVKQQVDERADTLAFVMAQLGVEPN